MQAPIKSGTILQNRYCIIQTLGQGGFGRTYLVEDSRRFNELCAIKELIPTVTEPDALEKAQELFQREAEILYRIQHVQVPQFRERFEQDQRLFLVQEYIPGKTYRTLLDERKAVGDVFTETEVLHLIRSLLPVLEHIHSQGIIHRDISPENIILRDTDRLPVLIDFGVVKELATRLQSPNTTAPTTYVGKLGYSPSEQMQTGRVYPSSDLYALAATAVVLLTGKEASQLFDETQLTWNWQRWVTINPQFVQILNGMLSYRPSDRYQNATDVAQALKSLAQPAVRTSNVQTVPVARIPSPVQPASSNKRVPQIPQPATNSILDNPLAVGAIGSAVVILAGLGSWALVSSIRNQSKEPQTTITPQTFPSPVISGSTSATPTPTSTPTPTLTPTLIPTPAQTLTPTKNQPIVQTKRLNFGASNTTFVEGTLRANEIHQYIFKGEKGQQLTALFAKESGVSLTVLGPNGNPIENTAKEVTFYQGILPDTSNYTLRVNSVLGVSQSSYNLSIGLENPTRAVPTPSPTVTLGTPAPTAQPPTEPPPVDLSPSLPSQTQPPLSPEPEQTQ
ncbi:protein kinase [Aetokthonos hydrillicola Thurmond2011]|uniref:non-specific serine/threonine protein kinase n=1 Tax=Aetokthonos hydrillicola Thurmond2011 TaxID=2712845 RepID=A0AAP5M7S6_9CYAN|nr:serine/threonine-protein kinase [Aetokthonos hydrillicola]MBO3457268.1 protein kinase [Aetokthonos hydrillicola CCALA 1050]MBW4586610.1 protein kinase [Aetokthonos hydrillicola CCALA 1050]MDR9894062.1 protein kinase [Aetokthonos hydrillicola Thurmond2011]